MLEHIFRNLTDIRVFDVFYSELSFLDESFDINEILECLDYPQREYIQVEDSINHLVHQKILEEVPKEVISSSGCKTCEKIDKMKIPRIGKHKNHHSYEENKTYISNYKIANNYITKYFFKALFQSIIEMEIEDDKERKEYISMIESMKNSN